MSLRDWAMLEAAVNGRTLFGGPNRDPDAPCEVYDPTADADFMGGLTASGGGDCDSDGHYLCKGCKRLSSRAIRERFEDWDADG